MARRKAGAPADEKAVQLSEFTVECARETMRSNQGVAVNDDQNSLKAGERGPTLMEDFLLREKITHFDHERIPERVVHARGAAAHGYFQVYEPLGDLTSAEFLLDPSVKTPVFVRFSTVAGSRGSSDLARDVRGFAVKFYTSAGNFDLVGNNMPVFFIQDAVKFPDLIHSVKPEPHNEVPQAASAHDTFWDFISLTPEAAHMVMWVMSDRAIPRSYRMMEGFGVHTFRFVNGKGKSRFVKFHWKPLLGTHSVTWDEALKISGKDPDFHRRDLWEAIEQGAFPQWELGVQIVEEENEHDFDFDLLDPTKLIPEELVPVRRIGRMTLDRNPDNFFAETEQVAFHVANIVPGIDFTNDPLMQGRLFSYLDTQLIRLGGPNFHEIPINRPLTAVHNNQRDGAMRTTINRGRSSYNPNSVGGGCPFQALRANGGFVTVPERMDGRKIRERGEKFFDHFSQAVMFFNSQTEHEKTHLIHALQFELSKVETPAIRTRMLGVLSLIHPSLAEQVAEKLGEAVPKKVASPVNHAVPADADAKRYEPRAVKDPTASSAALSMLANPTDSIATRKVAALVADGVDEKALATVRKALEAEGATLVTVAPRLGVVKGMDGGEVAVQMTLYNTASVLFDAVYVAPGAKAVRELAGQAAALHFIDEAFAHCKTVGASREGADLLSATWAGTKGLLEGDAGVVVGDDNVHVTAFINAMKQHRHWARENGPQVPM